MPAAFREPSFEEESNEVFAELLAEERKAAAAAAAAPGFSERAAARMARERRALNRQLRLRAHAIVRNRRRQRALERIAEEKKLTERFRVPRAVREHWEETEHGRELLAFYAMDMEWSVEGDQLRDYRHTREDMEERDIDYRLLRLENSGVDTTPYMMAAFDAEDEADADAEDAAEAAAAAAAAEAAARAEDAYADEEAFLNAPTRTPSPAGDADMADAPPPGAPGAPTSGKWRRSLPAHLCRA